jgi:hypothetical protein
VQWKINRYRARATTLFSTIEITCPKRQCTGRHIALEKRVENFYPLSGIGIKGVSMRQLLGTLSNDALHPTGEKPIPCRSRSEAARIKIGMVFASLARGAAFPKATFIGRDSAAVGWYRPRSSTHKGERLHGKFQWDFGP